jgi:hypothetical protein
VAGVCDMLVVIVGFIAAFDVANSHSLHLTTTQAGVSLIPR